MSSSTTSVRVPFLDLAAQQRALAEEMREAVLPLLDGARFVGGEPVQTFEQAFAEAQGSPFAVSVKSGTAALVLGLQALGVEPGDEVVVPAFTFIATAAAARLLGATPVFADVDPDTACLSRESVERVLSDRTRVVVAVHLYGQPAPVDELVALCDERGIPVLEDCAQSHLATWKGKPAGTFGAMGTFSFYPSKNLGAAGDAGAIITPDEALAERVRQLANHGRTGRYDHAFVGWNERLDAIQAAVLTVKLRHLPAWTVARREAACRYHGLLEGIRPFDAPLRLPVVREDADPVWHLYVVRHPERDRVAAALSERGIDTGTHYPTTLPAQPAFADASGGPWPEAEAWAAECLALPLFPEITGEQQQRVADALRSLETA